ncbi:Oxysterol-binding protein-domain-containing protein [Cerioporus squamosus]|nr:Oxysterol-binding protein-domain-containing protein [Cerioporus squamosus]
MAPETLPSSPSILGSPRNGTGLDSLYQVRLLSALRSGDPARIHPFLTDISKDRRTSSESDVDLGAAALHLAIRCASCDTIALLLSHRSISPNAVYPPGSGTTALHLAASLSRTDVVNLLLEQDGIDDSLRDSQGRTVLDVARGKDTIRAIRDSRALLTASYRSLLRSYIHSPYNEPPPDALVKLLDSPRIRLVDLSYLDDASGRTLLHEAARRKDLRLVEKAIRAGADVFVRDRKGRPVYESAPKDDKVRAFLRQCSHEPGQLTHPEPSSEPPELRGYLNKYTNVAKGYNTRWFVLHQGVLSYYRHQDDENLACRGSIALRTAVLTVPTGTSGLRFEVHSTPSRGHSSVQKWYLKANHPVEASRWITALQKSMEIAKRESEQQDRRSGESSAPSLKPSLSISGSSYNTHKRKDRAAGAIVSTASSLETWSRVVRSREGARSVRDPEQAVDGEGEDSTSEAGSTNQVPHANAFELQGNALLAQVDLASQLLSGLPAQAPGSPRAAELSKALTDTFHSVSGMLSEYVSMVKEREEWYKSKLERERERQNIWEESLQAVVREGDMLEKELRSRFRRRSRAPSVAQEGTIRRRPSALVSSPTEEVTTPVAAYPTPVPPPELPSSPPAESVPSPTGTIAQRRAGRRSSAGSSGPRFSLIMSQSLPATSALDDEAGDTDEEDEFFDAIESNTLPNLVITKSLIEPSPAQQFLNREVYAAYLKLRDRLSITSDDRPPMSLWAVLKNSIGKDLTKISFPVFFNEPTSMLQRMAEDMEFSECLDAAYAEEDPHRRIAFVAAFAMSNYSSTIGRIAKPFNPMLSETFEYVRHDKQYRYVSEQVSHHPPISACWAESPMWRYYGEVDAQNKFMGKSFEIRPTGVAHAELLLPEEQHFSWKKVTTNISGFILGSPTIDHYGDMIVTNHRTGDKCVLTFKPRGWRGKDAYEISGYVQDKEGNITYEIAGRWNSQLVARQVGTGVGQLHPDVAMGGPNSPTTNEYILLWRNSVKPPAPFNLTPFAITLNDCPEDTLKPYVCPTDCRMRPDQRAFELGKYERANDLKMKQEEFQRKVRRAREEGKAPPHRPRWFEATTEADTGERVWMPAMVDEQLEYWVEREKVWKKKHDEGVGEWKDVDRIFIDDEP